MSKAFDTVNIHTLIDKLTQTNIPHTRLRYIANYSSGQKSEKTTTYFSTQTRRHAHYSPQTQQNITHN